MLIACPNCATSYDVSAAAIGAAGRSVRCTRCRTVWHAAPPADVPALAMAPASAPMPEPASDETVAAFKAELGDDAPLQAGDEPPPATEDAPPAEAAADSEVAAEGGGPSLDDLMAVDAPEAETAPGAEPVDIEAAADGTPTEGEAEASTATLAEISIPVDGAPRLAPGAEDADADIAHNIESLAARRSRRPGTRKKRATAKWTPERRLPVIMLGLVCMIAVLISFRASIVKRAPQLASLYSALGMPVNLRGLVFTDVKIAKDTHDGVPVLVVEGSIDSAAKAPVEVPRLRFAVRNAAGAEVYAWTAQPLQSVLAPGESMAFRSRLAAPPKDGRDVVVRFFTHHDAGGGLR